jgi:multidrug efflux pump subunit AcrA (membrane-fusion protein)
VTKRGWIGVSVIVVALAGAGVWWWWPKPAPVKPKPVVVAPAPVATEWSGGGRIEPLTVIPVVAEIDGTVESLLVDAGQEVYEGQLVAQIRNEALDRDRGEIEAELTKLNERRSALETLVAQTRLEAFRVDAEARQTQQSYERIERLWQRQELLFREGATARRTYEQTRIEFEAVTKERDARQAVAKVAAERLAMASSDLETVKRQLLKLDEEFEASRTALLAMQVYAPKSGMVMERVLQTGVEVKKGQEILRMAGDLTRLRVVAEPEPAAFARIEKGAAVLIALAEQAEPVQASVTEVDKGLIRVEFVSPSAAVKPGVSAQVRVKLR